MRFVDYAICALLAAAVVAWWFPNLRGRRGWLAGAAAAAAVASLGAVVAYRWQATVATVAALAFLIAWFVGRFSPRSIKEGVVYWSSGVVLAALSAAAMLAFYWFPIIDLPAPTGPHKVGVRDFELVDESRRGIYAIAPDEPRRLAVRVWYPVDDTDGHRRIPYYSALEARTTARALGEATPLGAIFFQYLHYSRTNSHRGAPIPARFEQLPVVMFSHGYRGFKGQNTVLMEHLASHGYLAFALQHTYDSSTTVFPNGDTAPMDPAFVAELDAHRRSVEEHGYPQETIDVYTNTDLAQRRAAHLARNELPTSTRLVRFSAQVWVDDRVFLHDSLQRGEVPDSVADVVAAGEYANTGQLGMSYGGSVASAVCMVDRRCAAVANIDGEDRHAITFNRSMSAPMLSYRTDSQFYVDQISGGDETGQGLVDFSYERHETAGLRPDLYRIWLTDVSHYMHSDFGIFLSRNGNPFTKPLFGLLDGVVANGINNDIVRGFLDRHQRGADKPQHGAGYPQRQLREHSPHLERHDVSPVREWWLAENPQDRTVRVVFETALGNWALALYPERAPPAAARFLATVDAGGFDGVKIPSGTTSSKFGAKVGVVALPAVPAEAGAASPDAATDGFGRPSGIGVEHGVVAFDPGADGSWDAAWLVHLGEPGRLRYSGVADAQPTTASRMSGDLATCGRVLYGLRVLESIQRGSFESTQAGTADGSVVVRRAYRVVD